MDFDFGQAWNRDDPSQRPFFEAGFDAYQFCKRELSEQMVDSIHSEELTSQSSGKKAKLSLQDMALGANGDKTDVVVNPSYSKCKSQIKGLETHLEKYTQMQAEIKNLQVKYLALPVPEDTRVEYMRRCLEEIQASEIESLQLISVFSSSGPEESPELKEFSEKLDNHMTTCSKLYEAAVNRVAKNRSFLESL
jgi:hypothetical protein